MLYRDDRYGNKLSQLGYGCMRFTKKGMNIDLAKAEKEVLHAVDLGVNYFDTAYSYGGSEVALGKIVEKNGIRDKINIATKLPQYLVKTSGAIDGFFNEELSRLRTDHIDYYLMHMLTDVAAYSKLKKLGIEEWIAGKKASQQIRNIGFSFHGNTDMFLEILDAYDWDFCQIQYNYLDEDTQGGRAGLMAAAATGIPVIVMEPLRGGKLVDMMPADAKGLITKEGRGRTAAELAFRWLYDQPQVTCVLSGMNSLEMIDENCRVASESESGCLEASERELVASVRQAINGSVKVPCTGCGYCMPCPQGVDIPTVFNCYNHMFTENKGSGRAEYMQMMAFRKDMQGADKCISCGACVKRCPQSIEIPAELPKADRALRPWFMKITTGVMRLFRFW
ncbi:aldo/keto reductase [Aminicella lysinilytica]|uniref:aldo/keto reductase n=1 Tax=Aminicella lysinilytica TaxID=433323 RepID=UPI0026F36A33|nr:aldo/keto reductase [Aminicella lysinilytica]